MKILLLGPLWRNESIKLFLEEAGETVDTSNDKVSIDFLRENKIDLILSSGYPWIIKEPVISEYKDRIINLHATYLPWGKGIGTTLFAILEGSPLGATIHFIDGGIDTGDILEQERFYYNSNDTLRSVYDKLLKATEQLFLKNWKKLSTKSYKRQVQKNLDIEIKYRSRIDSERFMDLLPQKWDTPVDDLEKWAVELNIAEEFWRAYEADLESER